jgi:tetratricopeptide (TPR) repeat protein
MLPSMALDRVATFRTFIARTPGDPFPRYGLAMELRTRGDLEGSAAAFDELIALFPDYVPSYLMSGGVLAELGQRDQSLARYRRGIEVATARGDGHAAKELAQALADAEDAV